MSAPRTPRPPRLAESLLASLLPQEDRGPIMGDVAEEFAARVRADGVRAARRWYWQHAVQSSLPAANRRWRHWQGSGRSQRGQIMAKLGSLWLDVKLGLRMLVKFPGLTAVALLALALGIPAGVAPTHFANAWQAPPPLEEGERLQVLRNVDVDLGVVRPTALYDFIQWREALTSYSAIGAAIDGVYNVSDGDGVTTHGSARSECTPDQHSHHHSRQADVDDHGLLPLRPRAAGDTGHLLENNARDAAQSDPSRCLGA